MEVEKLEQKARKVFKEQGFTVSREGDVFVAEQDDVSKRYRCISSEEFDGEDVDTANLDLLFVDEELADLDVECEVSVLREDEREELEMPSYEIIGEIAVINELVDFSEEEAVERITGQHPNVKTVLLKTEPLQGEFRVGEYRKLYGGETETIHKEFGCRFRVDPTRVYYSERFSTERDRVVSRIEDGERVLVMFAGVGPFAIMAAKNARPSEVVAVEKNPAAAKFLRENIRLNSVEDTVEAREGDVEDVLSGERQRYDRVVMPLPGSAEEYLDLAETVLARDGTVHLYRFEDGDRTAPEGWKLRDRTVCGSLGPGKERVCLDLQLSSHK